MKKLFGVFIALVIVNITQAQNRINIPEIGVEILITKGDHFLYGSTGEPVEMTTFRTNTINNNYIVYLTIEYIGGTIGCWDKKPKQNEIISERHILVISSNYSPHKNNHQFMAVGGPDNVKIKDIHFVKVEDPYYVVSKKKHETWSDIPKPDDNRENCLVWYNGCNTCIRENTKSAFICTMRVCYEFEEAYCMQGARK